MITNLVQFYLTLKYSCILDCNIFIGTPLHERTDLQTIFILTIVSYLIVNSTYLILLYSYWRFFVFVVCLWSKDLFLYYFDSLQVQSLVLQITVMWEWASSKTNKWNFTNYSDKVIGTVDTGYKNTVPVTYLTYIIICSLFCTRGGGRRGARGGQGGQPPPSSNTAPFRG